MLRVFRHRVRMSTLVLSAFELLVIAVTFLAAASTVPFADTVPMALADGALFAVTLWLLMCASGIYEPAAQQSFALCAQRLLLSGIVGLALIHLAERFSAAPILQTAYPALCVAAAVGTILLGRLIASRTIASGAAKRRLLVLGTGAEARTLLRLHDLRGASDIALHGFVRPPQPAGDFDDVVPPGMVLPEVGSLSDYARQHGITEVVVALDDRAALPAGDLLQCKRQGVRVLDGATFRERQTGKIDLDDPYPRWLVFSGEVRRRRLGEVVKRLLDIVLSLAILLILLPVLAAAAVAIRLDGPGPVLRRETRVGRHGRSFRLLSFRALPAETKDGRATGGRTAGGRAAAGEGRRTMVGRFIHRHRIEEFPQFLNVLKGDMSLIGPCPERPETVRILSRHIRHYDDRHRVRPGLSGWAQIQHPRAASIEDAREKLRYDLYYMKNHSVLLDLAIMLRTARLIVSAGDALDRW